MSNFCGLSMARPKFVGGRILDALARTTGLAMIVITALMAGGCLGRDGEADEARLQMGEYRDELRMIHQSNDVLRREISDTYASCDLIGNQLVLMAAMDIHDKYTDGLGKQSQDCVCDPVLDLPSGEPQVKLKSAAEQPSVKPLVNRPTIKPTPKVGPGGDGSIDWGV